MGGAVTKPYACTTCGNGDDSKLMIIAQSPWVIECMQCGRPNDVRWEHDGMYEY